MHYHFETQPIPHYLSWYAHQLTPDIFKRYMVVGTFVFEILAPPLFYSPFREHRNFAALSNILLMASVILTGNYNFFNILTSTLLFVMLDDQFVLKYTPRWVLLALDIKVPMEQIVQELKDHSDDSWCCTKVLGKVRTIVSYTLLAAFFYLVTVLFPYDLVKEGKLPFKYEDVKALTSNHNLLVTSGVFMAIVVVLT